MGKKRPGPYGSGYWAVKTRCVELGVWDALVENRWQRQDKFLLPIDELATRKSIRQRVLRDKLIPYKCAHCSNPGEWQGKPLVLELHHKNGDGDDHRLDNVEFVCPNCHAQTPTWTGKNAKLRRIAGSSNGRKTDFDSVNGSSILPPAANNSR